MESEREPKRTDGAGLLATAVWAERSPDALRARAAELVEMHTLILGSELPCIERRQPQHPCIRRISALRQVANGGFFSASVDDLVRVASELALAMIDGLWAPARKTWSRFWETALPDERTRTSVVERLRKSDQYEPTLAQLYFAYALNSIELKADFIEAEGMADLSLRCESTGDTVPAEVKVVLPNSSDDRMRKHIAKASKQIRNTAGDAVAGPLYVLLRRHNYQFGKDGQVPADIGGRISVARKALASTDFRSVSEVVICWDDVQVIETGRGVAVAVTRRHLQLQHQRPRLPAALPASHLDVDATIVLALRTHR